MENVQIVNAKNKDFSRNSSPNYIIIQEKDSRDVSEEPEKAEEYFN
jgi:hypothetical protein